jgi:electron transport complex protein RnfG
MKEMIRYGFVLAIICIIASGLLAGVNSLTKPKIIAQARAEEQSSLKEVMPQAENFEPIKSAEDIIYYKAYDKNGKFMGVAFKASGKGYSSLIETMVGMLRDGTITAIKVLSQNETPGLGANVAEPPFASQFSHKNNLDDVQAITGATISSKAVIDSVRKKAEEIINLIKNEK